jgi:hypothetical protein
LTGSRMQRLNNTQSSRCHALVQLTTTRFSERASAWGGVPRLPKSLYPSGARGSEVGRTGLGAAKTLNRRAGFRPDDDEVS